MNKLVRAPARARSRARKLGKEIKPLCVLCDLCGG